MQQNHTCFTYSQKPFYNIHAHKFYHHYNVKQFNAIEVAQYIEWYTVYEPQNGFIHNYTCMYPF